MATTALRCSSTNMDGLTVAKSRLCTLQELLISIERFFLWKLLKMEETSTGLPEASNGVPSYAAKEELPPKESEATSATCSPSTFKKPICAQNLSHVASPKSSSFSEDFGSSSSSSKVIVSPVF